MKDDLREKIRDILFSASGGVSDMAEKETAKIMQLISDDKLKLKNKLLTGLPEKKSRDFIIATENGVADGMRSMKLEYYDRAIEESKLVIEEILG